MNFKFVFKTYKIIISFFPLVQSKIAQFISSRHPNLSPSTHECPFQKFLSAVRMHFEYLENYLFTQSKRSLKIFYCTQNRVLNLYHFLQPHHNSAHVYLSSANSHHSPPTPPTLVSSIQPNLSSWISLRNFQIWDFTCVPSCFLCLPPPSIKFLFA